MKKFIYTASCLLIVAGLMSCGGGKSTKNDQSAQDTTKNVVQTPATPEYSVVTDLPNVDISTYKADKDGFITLFDGKTFT